MDDGNKIKQTHILHQLKSYNTSIIAPCLIIIKRSLCASFYDMTLIRGHKRVNETTGSLRNNCSTSPNKVLKSTIYFNSIASVLLI